MSSLFQVLPGLRRTTTNQKSSSQVRLRSRQLRTDSHCAPVGVNRASGVPQNRSHFSKGVETIGAAGLDTRGCFELLRSLAEVLVARQCESVIVINSSELRVALNRFAIV